MKRFSHQATFAAVLAAALMGASELPAKAHSRLTQARPLASGGQEILVAGRLGFRVRVRPSRFRIGGFSRGSCPRGINITPVTPPTRPEETAPGQNLAVDSTASAHPTLFVNVPAELASKTAQLTLQDEAGSQQLYETTFTLTDKPGIVGIRIPDSAQPLEVGQKYLWQLSVVCNPDEEQDRVYTNGWVERVPLEPTLASQLQQASPREKLLLYADAGIWQDTLSTLAELRYNNPSDQSLDRDWASLMEEVNLQDFANKSVVQIAEN